MPVAIHGGGCLSGLLDVLPARKAVDLRPIRARLDAFLNQGFAGSLGLIEWSVRPGYTSLVLSSGLSHLPQNTFPLEPSVVGRVIPTQPTGTHKMPNGQKQSWDWFGDHCQGSVGETEAGLSSHCRGLSGVEDLLPGLLFILHGQGSCRSVASLDTLEQAQPPHTGSLRPKEVKNMTAVLLARAAPGQGGLCHLPSSEGPSVCSFRWEALALVSNLVKLRWPICPLLPSEVCPVCSLLAIPEARALHCLNTQRLSSFLFPAGHECGGATGAQPFNGVSDFDLVIIPLFTGISISASWSVISLFASAGLMVCSKVFSELQHEPPIPS
ncbi:hypothetical protein E5288_WYG010924 [Bos mutus]|uniref:Uncharacterized protein n=1 Tax=Bos mutus TaxID=72004 RepID=A0A6B0QZ63_9CETA|nr:hypothetical protein [Bos mutus]